jgi:truncated hemoglobin YjbI
MSDAEPPGLTEDLISEVVGSFYAKVRRDPVLGPVFARAIADDAWPEHLAIISDFWSTVMLKTGRYRRNPSRRISVSRGSVQSCLIIGCGSGAKRARSF